MAKPPFTGGFAIVIQPGRLKEGLIHDLPPFIQDFPPDIGVLNAYFHEAIAKTFVTVHKTKSYEKTCVTSFSFISRTEIIYPKPL